MVKIPIVIKLRTTLPTFLSSLKRRLSPPSNRIMATETDTRGNSSSPKRSSGLRIPRNGPAIRPEISNSKIAGRFILHDNHWDKMPSIIMLARPTNWCSKRTLPLSDNLRSAYKTRTQNETNLYCYCLDKKRRYHETSKYNCYSRSGVHINRPWWFENLTSIRYPEEGHVAGSTGQTG